MTTGVDKVKGATILLHADLMTHKLLAEAARPWRLETPIGWKELTTRAASARAVVLVWPQLDPNTLGVRLDELRTKSCGAPIVLVTSCAPANAHFLAPVKLDAVVWLEHVRETLSASLAEVVNRSVVSRLGDAIRRQDTMPADLRQGLADACEAGVRLDVRTLARHCSMSVATLERRWRRTYGARSNWMPRDFVAAVRILHAVDAAQRGCRPTLIERDLGRHTRALQRAAKRFYGASLRDILTMPPERVLERLAQLAAVNGGRLRT